MVTFVVRSGRYCLLQVVINQLNWTISIFSSTNLCMTVLIWGRMLKQSWTRRFFSIWFTLKDVFGSIICSIICQSRIVKLFSATNCESGAFQL